MSHHITGTRWFNRTYGNTYNKVYIYRDGDLVAELPCEYGYGDYYLQRAEEWLSNNGFPELQEKHQNGSRKYGGTEWMRNHAISYNVIDVDRKKDL